LDLIGSGFIVASPGCQLAGHTYIKDRERERRGRDARERGAGGKGRRGQKERGNKIAGGVNHSGRR
jgi:hypothetical protein